MRSRKEVWYRTGTAAKLLGISPRQLRQLARATLIECEERNGYLYTPAREIERLNKEGIPPVPAGTALNALETDSDPPEADGAARPTRRSLPQDLYAEPSRQLARSKETLIRLEHAAEAKRIKAEMREGDRRAREEKERVREVQMVQTWREGHIRRAAAAVPGEVCADVCSRIERLLDSVPPLTDVGRQVAEIIDSALRPVRQRKEQARALVSHNQRIANAIQSINLLHDSTLDEREEARDLIRSALQNLPLGASDRELRRVVEEAIQPVTHRIKQRQADAARRLQEGDHERRISQIVALIPLQLVYDLSDEEMARAKALLRTALEQLPPTATGGQMSATRNQALAPFEAAIQRRKSISMQIEECIRQLESENRIIVDGYLDRCVLRDNLTAKLKPMLTAEVAPNSAISEADFTRRVRELVNKHHTEFCD